MSAAPSASETLDREFLALRARLMDLAAGLDRQPQAQEPPHQLSLFQHSNIRGKEYYAN